MSNKLNKMRLKLTETTIKRLKAENDPARAHYIERLEQRRQTLLDQLNAENTTKPETESAVDSQNESKS